MITHLMTEENFEKVLRDDGSPLNVTRARVWFEVSTAQYYLKGPALPASMDNASTPLNMSSLYFHSGLFTQPPLNMSSSYLHTGLFTQPLLPGVQRELRGERVRRERQVSGGGVVRGHRHFLWIMHPCNYMHSLILDHGERHLRDSSDQFSCSLRNMSLVLASGHLYREAVLCLCHIISSDVYRGETSRAMLPHGHGVEFQQETGDGDIL